ncbi:glucan-alpha-1,4-glucosidase-like protein [Mytilinidion resinicola]|uniref:glucan 1,4-alpha-glucosidase n=1 Tax=Mytilinidion resinicola TaxID=574789 RepID=A0A6A6Z700_9PEZI|nr:glucan-alpha-1,4-glucosidase-like protein [Mytilinidion resinicola]KAF2816443.1 glucan-alpha-1,4-glucosidase-like protein [Mytilinidion resinicola]
MTLLVPLLFAAYLVLYAFALALPPFPHAAAIEQNPLQQKPQYSLDEWLQREEDIALDNLLANVAPFGRNVQDAAPGSVIASPSKEHPNYYYQWVRDAAITTSTLVDLYADDPFDPLSSKLDIILNAYASLQDELQHTKNPSGTFADLSGLGEPKFEADGTPFIGSWGRPQRDGPALRAITLMAYLRAYNASNPSLWTSDEGPDWFKPLYDPRMPANSIIKADLEYVSHYWNASGFDLWEEVQGLHFFTAMVQLRALREGAALALAFDDSGAAAWYTQQAGLLEKFLPSFWDASKGHLIETLSSARSGLDCGLLLGSLHGSPAANNTVPGTPPYAPYSDEILVSLLALVYDQRNRFPINSAPPASPEGTSPLEGVGLGRYPEDVYDGYGTTPFGGNPWFLCTSSASEILYRVAAHLQETDELEITELGMPFWEALLADAPSFADLKPGSYGSKDGLFVDVLERLRSVGDGFLEVVKKHTDAEGSLSEQFDRVTGFERGARDLTWSYGAFLQAVRARGRV